MNETFAGEGASPVSVEDVLSAIDAGKSEGGSLGQHWVLDPIDGTKGWVLMAWLMLIIFFVSETFSSNNWMILMSLLNSNT